MDGRHTDMAASRPAEWMAGCKVIESYICSV